jgi:hypothetical protein
MNRVRNVYRYRFRGQSFPIYIARKFSPDSKQAKSVTSFVKRASMLASS